jgi:valyl-tRNA synthetase
MPFITETLWQRLPLPVIAERCEFLAIAPWPIPIPLSREDKVAVGEFDLIREAVGAVRQIRSDYSIAPGTAIDVNIRSSRHSHVFNDSSPLIGRLSRSNVSVDGQSPAAGAAHAVLTDGTELIVPLGGIVDLKKECAKLRTELDQLDKQLESLSKRLDNEGFTSRAPAHVVDSERKKKDEWLKRRDQLAAKVKAVCDG